MTREREGSDSARGRRDPEIQRRAGRLALPERLAPKALLFDFGGTLDSDGMPWKERFYPIYREAGIEWDLPRFERFFHASDDSLTAERLDEVGYEAMLLEQVSRVLRNGDRYDEPLASRISDRFYSDSMSCLNRNRPILQRLSKRYRLGIVSNFYGNLRFLCEEIGYDEIFTTVIDSARIGISKPSSGIFQAALDRLGCAPEEAIFVGDHPVRDMAGSRALAMPHIWLNTIHPERKPCCDGDPVIRSLTELEKILP
ncbi:MAG: HAD family hydrolase [Terrimicrobiaceae bacterium]